MGLPHEVDAISGAFFFTRHDLLRSLHGFDEDYFMYGEYVDLSYRIQKRGFKIMYYPVYSILHLKYQSGLKTSDPSVKSKTKDYFYDAMKIFFKKHYAAEYPSFITPLVDSFIDLKKRFS